MIGLRYIRKLYSMSMQDLANKLGVTRSTVYQWENKKIRISIDSLDKISKLFNIDKIYFEKELDKPDELDIQRKKIENELNDSKEEVLFEETNRQTGEQYFRYEQLYDTDLISKRESANNELTKERLIRNIRKTLSVNNDSLKLYERFEKIIQSCENKTVLNKVLKALEIYCCGGFDTNKNIKALVDAISKLDTDK